MTNKTPLRSIMSYYSNLQMGIHETPVYLEKFFRNLLMGEDNELKNRYLHIDWQKKTTHSGGKQHIERHIERHIENKNNLLDLLNANIITERTQNNIIRLGRSFGMEKIFGRNDVVDVLGITEKPASTLIKRMLNLGVIENVRGPGKGKYRFVAKCKLQ